MYLQLSSGIRSLIISASSTPMSEGSVERPSMQACMPFAASPHDKHMYQNLMCCWVDDRLSFKLVNVQLLTKCSKLITASVTFLKNK